jgi:hypothetical protein
MHTQGVMELMEALFGMGADHHFRTRQDLAALAALAVRAELACQEMQAQTVSPLSAATSLAVTP